MNKSTAGQTGSKGTIRIGTAITMLTVLFLAFDGIAKVIRVAPVMEACQKMGLGPETVVGVGLLLLLCTTLYLIPRTVVLGAVLLTGYLGGAIATHVITKSGAFPAAFALGFGVLVWAGLILRQPQVLRSFFLRH